MGHGGLAWPGPAWPGQEITAVILALLHHILTRSKVEDLHGFYELVKATFLEAFEEIESPQGSLDPSELGKGNMGHGFKASLCRSTDVMPLD